MSTTYVSDGDLATPTNINEWLNRASGEQVNVKSYGALGDGSTDDTDSIKSALDAAAALASTQSGAVVNMPPGTYVVTSPLRIPNRVTLRGAGRTSSTISASATSFSQGTAVVFLEPNNDGPTFNTRLEDVEVFCSNITGSIGVYTQRANELSGLHKVLVNRSVRYGVHVDNSEVGAVAENFNLTDVEVIMGSNATASSSGVFIMGGGASIRGLDHLTVVKQGLTGSFGAGLHLEGASGMYTRMHFENVVDGVRISDNTAGVGIVISGVIGHSTVSNTIRVGTATPTDVVLSGIRKNAGTNVLVDDTSGTTETDASLSLRVVGGKFALDKNSSDTGVTIKGRAGNTNAHLVFKDSSDTVQSYVNNSGDFLPVSASQRNLGSGDSRFRGWFSMVDCSNNTMRVVNSYTPSSGTGGGVQGSFAWDNDYFYVATSSNSWKRVGLSAF